MGEPIDFVIAWVDGDDPQLREKRAKYLGSDGGELGAAPTRFANLDEIHYSLNSMRVYAPWVNRIYIVTDGQVPEAVAKIRKIDAGFADKIKIIDHKIIFRDYEDLLPSFNSLSIETMLWRIPDLSEHFVYFNDDFLLASPSSVGDFFEDGVPVYRGKWMGAWYGAVIAFKKLGWAIARTPASKRRASYKDAQYYATKLATGKGRFFALSHIPYPARRSSFEALFRAHPEWFRANAAYRFRDYRQFNPFSLVRAWDIKRGQAKLLDDYSCVFLRGGDDSEERMREKIADIESGNYRFACINSLDEAPEAAQADILNMLGIIFGEK